MAKTGRGNFQLGLFPALLRFNRGENYHRKGDGVCGQLGV